MRSCIIEEKNKATRNPVLQGGQYHQGLNCAKLALHYLS